MEKEEEIFGCFVRVAFDPNLEEQDFQNLAKTFRIYTRGEKGICDIIKKLNYKNYGKDLVLILFQFILNPTQSEVQRLKEIEGYRKSEKAIGIPIIVNDENFFSKSEQGRYSYLKEAVLHKLDLLTDVVKKKKLDTDMERLKFDLRQIFSENER